MDSLPTRGSGEKRSNNVIRNNHQPAAELRCDLETIPASVTSLQLARVDPGSVRPALWIELGMYAQMEDWKKPREVKLSARGHTARKRAEVRLLLGSPGHPSPLFICHHSAMLGEQLS